MNVSLPVRLAGTILIVAATLGLSGCGSFGSRIVNYGDPPYQGVQWDLSGTFEKKSGDLLRRARFVADLPLSLLMDTLLLPIDFADMSKDTVYYGRVVHAVTGQPLSGVVVVTTYLRENDWDSQRVVGAAGHERPSPGPKDDVQHRTRTDKDGRFTFQLHAQSRICVAGFVALKKGYAPAWQFRPYTPREERNRQMPPLRLFPEAAPPEGKTE